MNLWVFVYLVGLIVFGAIIFKTVSEETRKNKWDVVNASMAWVILSVLYPITFLLVLVIYGMSPKTK